MSKLSATLLIGLALAAASATAGVQGEVSLSGTYLAGRSAGKDRDNALASQYIRNALKIDPGNTQLTERLFLMELSQGKIAESEDLAEQVLDFNSQQRMARVVLGVRDFRAGKFDGSREHFQEAAYTPIGELTSGLLTAWSHAGEGKLGPALKALDSLETNDSFVNFRNFHGALICDLLGSPLRAEAFYKKAYAEAGTSLRVVQSYGNFLTRNNRPEDARKLYAKFLEGDDNPLVAKALADLAPGTKPAPFVANAQAGAAEALFSLATAMTDEQSIDVALLYTQPALSFDPTSPVILTLLGDVFGDTQRYEDAIAAYDRVAADSVLAKNAIIEASTDLQRLDRDAEAQARLEALVAKDPRDQNALISLGNLFRGNEVYDKAADAYSKAIALIGTEKKDDWRVYYYRGIAFERLKQWDKAETDFRKALALSPEESLVLNYLGYSMIEKKINLSEALTMVKKAVELRPNDGFIADSLGWAYYQLGDYEQALVNCERAVELAPADPIIGEHLGDVYWKVGRKLEAKFQWQHAKDNKPEPEDLKRIEDKLANGLKDDPAVKPVETKPTQNNG